MENNTITPQFSLKTLLYKLPPKLFLIANTILWFAAGLIITPLLQNLPPCHPCRRSRLPRPHCRLCRSGWYFNKKKLIGNGRAPQAQSHPPCPRRGVVRLAALRGMLWGCF